MKQLYQNLFDYYGAEILNKLESYHEPTIDAYIKTLPLPESAQWELSNQFFDCYNQWSLDAFCVGLHLGLSLSSDNIRRAGPQQLH